jgi:acetyl esterase/lipase
MDFFQRLVRNPWLRALFTAKRALRGPKRPTWSLEYEIAAEFMRLYGPALRPLTPAQQRRAAEALLKRGPLLRDTERRVAPVDGLHVEWFEPAPTTSDAVLLYLHGGGYVLGSIDTHQNLIAALCHAAGCRAFVPNYRLAPEHPFPAAIDDVETAYRALLAEVRAERVVIAGDSAGGGLALATMLRLRTLGLPLPRAAVLISPWVDLEGSGASLRAHERYDYIHASHLARTARFYLGGSSNQDPLASPLYADLTGLPPMLIQAGGAEGLLDDAVRLRDRARMAGVAVELQIHPDMIHVFHLFASFAPEAQRAVREFGAFVREHTDCRAPSQDA